MKYITYALFIMFILLVLPAVALQAGIRMDAVLYANLFLQAPAFILCIYYITTSKDPGLRIIFGIYALMILVFYFLALIVAAAPIPEKFG